MADWVYGSPAQNPNAELIARIIAGVGDDITQALVMRARTRAQEKDFQLESLSKLAEFTKLPPQERQRILSTPNGAKMVMGLLDPHLYSKHNEKKEGPGPSYEGVLQLGSPTELEKAQLGKAQAEYGKAQNEQSSSELKLRNEMRDTKYMDEFLDLSRKYNEGDASITPAKLVGAAQRAGIKEAYSNPEALMDPDTILAAKRASVPGSAEWKTANTQTQLKSLMEAYPVTNPKEMAAVRSLAEGLTDPSKRINWDDLPKSWKAHEEDLRNKQLGLQQRTERRIQLENAAKMVQYLVDNGVDPKKAEKATDEYYRTGKLPADTPMPADRKAALENQRTEGLIKLTTAQLQNELAKDPKFQDVMEMARSAISAKDEKGTKKYMALAWDIFSDKYPQYKGQAQPGFWSKLFFGTGKVVQGAAGMTSAVVSDAAAATEIDPNSYVPPVLQKAGGMVAQAGRAVAPALEAVPSAMVEGGMSAIEMLMRGVQQVSPSPDARRGLQQYADTLSDWRQNAYGTPEGAPGPAPVSANPQLQAVRERAIGTIEERIKNLATMPAQERDSLLLAAKALQEAGDDAEKLTQVLMMLGIK